MADTLKSLRVELTASTVSFEKGFKSASASADNLGKSIKGIDMDRLHADALRMNDAFDKSGQRAGAFADTVGRVSTTMARSAESFGLPVGPLRALDDVADIAELGLNNLSKAAVGFNAASVGAAGAGLALGTAIGTAIRNFTGLGEWLDKTADKLVGLTRVEEEAREASRKALAIRQANQEALLRNESAVDSLTVKKVKEKAATDALARASELLGIKVKDLAQAERVLALAEENGEAGQQRAAEARKRAAKERGEEAKKRKLEAFELAQTAEESLKALSNIGMVFGKLQAVKLPTLGALGKTLAGMPMVTQKSYENLLKLAEAAGKAGLGAEQIQKKLEAAGIPAEDARRIVEDLNLAVRETADDTRTWGEALEGAALLAGLFSDEIAGVAQVVGNIADEFARVSKMEDGAAKDAAKLSAILGGIGQIGKVLASSVNPELQKLGGAIQGASAGAQAGGQAFGGWGAAIGGVAGAILGWVASAQAIKMQVNDMRDEFIKAHGGWLELQRSIRRATDEDLLKQLFDAATLEDYEAAMNRIKDTLDNWNDSQQAVNDAIERYGLTIEELGPAFARQKLDEMAGQLIQDYRLLEAGGANMNAVLAKMAPNVSDFVNQSLRAGQAIPEAMRPIIEQLIAQGKLLDENGNAYTSVEQAGITFAQTMTEQFQTLIEKIDAMVDAIMRFAGIEIPPVTVPIHYEYDKNPPSDSSGAGHPVPPDMPSLQHGGVGNFGTGTLAMLHGLEAVIPLDGFGGNGPGSAALLDEVRALRADYAELPRIMANAVRSAMALS